MHEKTIDSKDVEGIMPLLMILEWECLCFKEENVFTSSAVQVAVMASAHLPRVYNFQVA